jgi:hypothetical protein
VPTREVSSHRLLLASGPKARRIVLAVVLRRLEHARA